ncbi:MAG: DUF2786 domain-containing protein [Pseudonocardiaceae bacterium]|nr:DUF2786 domain-containing protein [Pseudonocardiaceae bacterium]
MGTRNRERRAAKAKRRAHRRAGGTPPNGWAPPEDGWPPPGARGWPGAPPPPEPEPVEAVLAAAARHQLDGDRGAVRDCAEELVATRPAAVDTAAQPVLVRALGTVWTHGWLPYDVHQIAQRRLDSAGVRCVVDAIAADTQQYAAATVHQRWDDQLRQIDATVWWQAGTPYLQQWARQRRCGSARALVSVVEALAMLAALPSLPQILPPPGTAQAGSATPSRGGVDQKVLTRVRALLAKAESTGFAEEAEALSAKAQQLMSRHALERAMVEADEGHDPDPATARRLWLDNPYVGAKALLVDAVASANRCRAMFVEQLGFVTVLGDDTDLEIVELLTTSLLVQATKAMLAAGSRITRTGQSRTRSYRQSFLVAYATRIGERLSTATEEAMTGGDGDAVAEPDRLLPVLAARERVVDELFESMFPRTVQRSFSVSNVEGWHAGRAAADLALLDTHHRLDATSG